jgi:hypothetical protein
MLPEYFIVSFLGVNDTRGSRHRLENWLKKFDRFDSLIVHAKISMEKTIKR